MFDQVQTYSGYVMDSDNAAEVSPEVTPERIPVSPQDYIEQAQREAAEIVANAKAQAETEIQSMKAAAEIEIEQQISERVSHAAITIGPDLWSARHAMAEIVGDALDRLIGDFGKQNALIYAVENAAKKYAQEHPLVVRAHPKNANRLKVNFFSARRKSCSPPTEVIEDDGLAEDRCILTFNGRSIEVGLEQQIEAIKRIVAQSLHVEEQAAAGTRNTAK